MTIPSAKIEGLIAKFEERAAASTHYCYCDGAVAEALRECADELRALVAEGQEAEGESEELELVQKELDRRVRQVAACIEVACKHGWNGVENSKSLSVFFDTALAESKQREEQLRFTVLDFCRNALSESPEEYAAAQKGLGDDVARNLAAVTYARERLQAKLAEAEKQFQQQVEIVGEELERVNVANARIASLEAELAKGREVIQCVSLDLSVAREMTGLTAEQAIGQIQRAWRNLQKAINDPAARRDRTSAIGEIADSLPPAPAEDRELCDILIEQEAAK